MLKQNISTCVVSAAAFSLAVGAVIPTAYAAEEEYKKAVEGDDVVKNKLFPKKGRLELTGPDFGVILNQSYVNTMLLHGGLNYYITEVWGLGIEAAFAINNNKDERTAIESFYNNPRKSPGPEFGEPSNIPAGGNYGPAYVPIRELKYILAANAIWNPVYGKQIMLLRATAYFDVFVTMGAGLAFADEYPKSTELRNGKDSRGKFSDPPNSATDPGAGPTETDSTGRLLFGPEGRPDPVSKSNFLVDFGIGQKYHFLKRFNVKAELRNYTLLGTESGFDNFFTLWGGFGVRF